MAAESNSSSSGFHPQLLNSSSSSSSLNGLAINFRSRSISSSAPEMIPMGLGSGSGYFGGRGNSNMGLNSGGSAAAGLIGSGSGLGRGGVTGSGCLLVDSVPGLKHDAGVAVEWSDEEQYILEEGLERFSAEPTIMKYVKIAATLRDKTVRDVALRCRWWISRKRRKPEEQNLGKKVYNRKDKLGQSSTKFSVSSSIPMMSEYSLMTGHMGRNELMYFNALSGTTKSLLEQNAQDFSQISANLSTFKLQENIDLFCRTRNNITTILNDMNETPGIMSQMPPLPVSIDDDLINSFLHNGTQGLYSRV